MTGLDGTLAQPVPSHSHDLGRSVPPPPPLLSLPVLGGTPWKITVLRVHLVYFLGSSPASTVWSKHDRLPWPTWAAGQRSAWVQAGHGWMMGQNHGSGWWGGGERPRYSERWFSEQCTLLHIKGDAVEIHSTYYCSQNG